MVTHSGRPCLEVFLVGELIWINGIVQHFILIGKLRVSDYEYDPVKIH